MRPRLQCRALFLLVVSVPLAGCSAPGSKIKATLNESAALSGNLPAHPLQWRVITSMLDAKDSTMSTLYGNDAAVQYARSNAQHSYPDGSTLSLVTWAQTDDDRWFGARIPSQVKSVEFVSVQVSPDGLTYSYERYEGSPLKRVSMEKAFKPNERSTFLLSQRAAVMP